MALLASPGAALAQVGAPQDAAARFRLRADPVRFATHHAPAPRELPREQSRSSSPTMEEDLRLAIDAHLVEMLALRTDFSLVLSERGARGGDYMALGLRYARTF